MAVSLPLSRGAWNTGAREVGEDMPRKPLDIRLHCHSLSGAAKTAVSWLLPPGEGGSGQSPFMRHIFSVVPKKVKILREMISKNF